MTGQTGRRQVDCSRATLSDLNIVDIHIVGFSVMLLKPSFITLEMRCFIVTQTLSLCFEMLAVMSLCQLCGCKLSWCVAFFFFSALCV